MTNPPKGRAATETEEALILQLYANQLTNHILGIYLRERSRYDQLWSIFKRFHEMLHELEAGLDKKGCPAGSVPCGDGRCCVHTGVSGQAKGS